MSKATLTVFITIAANLYEDIPIIVEYRLFLAIGKL